MTPTQKIRVADQLRIGRSPGNDMVRADRRLSWRHCRLYRSGGALYVEDLGSTNGTYVNGETVILRRRLRRGDVIQAGSHRFEVGA